jgi:mediator of RNA polymerase II transcription subunit 31
MPYYSNQQQHIQQPGTPHSNSNSSTSSNVQFDQMNAQHYNQSGQMDPQQANYSFNHQNEGQDFYHQQQLLFKQQRDKELQLIQIKQLEFERQEKEKREREIQIELEEKKRKQEQHLQQRKRFLVELEFVQCLANPNYLNYLAGRGLFDNDSFKNYLKYLLYWKKPEYIKYVKFPECLFFLELIQHENLQSILKDAKCTSFILEQQLLHWKYYLRNREQQQRQEVEELIIDLAPEAMPSEKEVELISSVGGALMSAKDDDVEMEEEALSLAKNKAVQKSNKNVNLNASKAVVSKVKSKQVSSLPAIAPLNAAQVTTLKKILPHPTPSAQPNSLLSKKPSSNSLANAFSSSSNKLAKSSSNSASSPANSKQGVGKTTNSSGSSNVSPLKRPSSSSSSSMISQNRNSKQQAISKAQNH